jgi:hypothetical protein
MRRIPKCLWSAAAGRAIALPGKMFTAVAIGPLVQPARCAKP